MILSESSVLKELAFASDSSIDIEDFIERANSIIESNLLTEAEYNKITEHLRLEILNVELFVKQNNCQPISNPRAFSRDGIPSDDGLLSNKIFGITKDERAGIFGYIDLQDWFMDPSCYKTWIRLNPHVKNIVHGIGTYRINDLGQIVEDPAGKTGIEFLRKNLDKINFKKEGSKSVKRDISVKYLESNRKQIFINKYLVIPAFYRDKNSGDSSRTVGLGGINKLYNNLIVASNALLETQDFMFDASDAMRGRVQETILMIYDWFCGNTNANIKTELGTGMSGKTGVIRRTVMTKTANFSSRLVISAPELKVERVEDMMVDFDKCAAPLSAVIADFRDFVMYHTRRFFENEFNGIQSYPIMGDDGKIRYEIVKDPQITFSDERIKKEMDRFLHGYNNRFVPIEIPIEGTDEKYYMMFKGRGAVSNIGKEPEAIYNRKLTWCDVFYMASVEATKDKHALITRFPIDAFSNQFVSKIEVSSTKETEQIYFNDTFYKYYPKIRKEDIGIDTSNKFADTIKISNLYLPGCGGDYDGDQVTFKGVYTVEANEELDRFMNSKNNLINFGCAPLRESTADVIQSVYSLTKILSTVKVTNSKLIEYK